MTSSSRSRLPLLRRLGAHGLSMPRLNRIAVLGPPEGSMTFYLRVIETYTIRNISLSDPPFYAADRFVTLGLTRERRAAVRHFVEQKIVALIIWTLTKLPDILRELLRHAILFSWGGV